MIILPFGGTKLKHGSEGSEQLVELVIILPFGGTKLKPQRIKEQLVLIP